METSSTVGESRPRPSDMGSLFRAAFEGSRDAMFIADEALRFVAVNQAAAALTGTPSDALRGTPVSDLFAPIDRISQRSWCDRITAGRSIQEGIRITRGDGQCALASLCSRRLSVSGMDYVHLTVRCVGANEEGSETTKGGAISPEAFLEIVLNSFPGNVAVIDSDGCIKRTNDGWEAFCQANGLPGHFMGQGANYLEICRGARGVGSDLAREVAEALEGILRGERRYYDIEYSCHSPDQRRWFHLQAQGFTHGRQRWAVLSHIDITERESALEELLESERRFEYAMDATTDGLYDWNIQSNEVYYSPSYFTMLGYDPDELPHTFATYRKLLHPEDAARSADLLAKYLATGCGESSIEMRYRHKSGNWMWILSRGKIVEYDDKGAPLRFVGTNVNIDHLKKQEESLRLEKMRAQQYLDIAGVMLVALDTEQRVTLINPKGCEVLGCTEQEILGRNWFDEFIPIEQVDAVKQVFDQMVGGNLDPVEYYENPVRRKDGTQRLIAWRNSIVYDPCGRVAGLLSSGEDITERKQAERALLESQERFDLVMKATRDGLWDWNIATGQVYFSPAWCRILGESRVAPEYRSWEDRLHPLDRPVALKHLQEHLDGNTDTWRMEHRLRARGGQWRWVLGRGRVVARSESGQALRMVGTIVDIRERKCLEGQLDATHHLLDAWMDHSPAVAFIKNLNGRITYVNAAFEQLFALPREEIVGKTDYDLYPMSPETARRMQANDHRVLETGDPMRFDETVMVGDEPRHFETIKFPLRDADSRITSIAGMAIDVTSSRKSQDALQRSEERFRNVFETAPDLITNLDARGIIVDCNQRIRDVVGYEKQEIIGQSIRKIIHPNSHEDALVALEEIVSGGFSLNREFIMVRKDGRSVDVSINSSGIKDEVGQLHRTVCIIQDITLRKKAEARVETYQQRLRSLAAKAALASERERRRIAMGLHDHIGQGLAMLKFTLQAARANRGDRCAEVLTRASMSADKLMDQLRSLSFELSNSVLYTVGLKEALLAFLEKTIPPEHELEHTVDVSGDLGQLDSDTRFILYRDLRELVLNVVKHAQAQHVHIRLTATREQIVAQVEDDGKGLDVSSVETANLCDRHFGLFSIREQMEGLGGSMKIDSGHRRGARVVLTVPIQRLPTCPCEG